MKLEEVANEYVNFIATREQLYRVQAARTYEYLTVSNKLRPSGPTKSFDEYVNDNHQEYTDVQSYVSNLKLDRDLTDNDIHKLVTLFKRMVDAKVA